MSNVTITNLPSTTAVQSTDKIPAVQNGTTVYVTASQIASYTQAAYTYGPAIPAGYLIGNPGVSTAIPVATSYSGLMDIALGSTQGQIMYRGSGNWQALNPGALGQILRSGGPNANPFWSTVSGTGSVYSITMGTNMVSTQNPLVTAGTISVSTDPIFNSLTLNTPLTVNNGGTGLSSITQYGIMYGNNAGAVQTIAPPTGTNYVLVGSSTGTFTWQENIPVTAGVNTVSFGTTGLTPNTPTEGDVVVAGTLVVANGGTGATTAPGGLANLMTYETFSTATKTLTNTSSHYQNFTGTTSTVYLPVASTLQLGWSYYFINSGSGNLNIASSGFNAVATVLPGMSALITCILTSGTTAASWKTGYTGFSSYTGSGQVTLATSPVIQTSLSVSGFETITSSSANSLAVGPNGATNPTFNIDASTASAATGFNVKSAAAGAGVALSAISSGTNENLTLDAKGSGTITIAGTSTGAVTISRATTIATSATVPLVIGGTTASSSLTLQSTSGSGTTDSIIFKVGNNGATTALTIGTGTAGSLTFGGTAQRFLADFSNATVNSRFAFQSSTTNGSTGIYALPNGTSTAASWQATNNADPTNASKILIATNASTDVQLVSGINGTGTYLPLSFYTNGGQVMQLGTGGSLALGPATNASASTGILNSWNITGATTAYGQLNNGVIQSAVTSDAQYYNATGQTAAAAFTLSNMRGFYYRQSTIGSGSTVTNQYGFFVESDVIGATNNYGFYGNIASASNRWNLYMNGSASNYVAGSLGLGTTSGVSGATPTAWLQIAAGTSTKAPIVLGSGTNLSTAAAGAIEYNGTTVLATPIGTERGIVTSPQYYVNNATRTGPAAATTFVNILPVNPSLTASTRYSFEIYFAITKTSANACTGAIGFAITGTAPAAMSYSIVSTTGATQPTVAAASYMSNYITTGFATAVVATAASAAAANTYHTVKITGTIDTGAGAITSFAPQFQYSTGAPTASTFQVGAYMYIYPLSASASATSVGTWA